MVLGAIKDGDRYLFGKWIANIADARSVFPYDMTTQEVEYEDGKHPTVCIDWETPMFDKQLDEFEAFQTSSNQKELVAIDELEDELKNGEWHMKSPLVDRVKSKARCSAKTVERAADQLAAQGLLEKQRTNTTPSKMMWRRPPV